jgi:hypothetical protein
MLRIHGVRFKTEGKPLDWMTASTDSRSPDAAESPGTSAIIISTGFEYGPNKDLRARILAG